MKTSNALSLLLVLGGVLFACGDHLAWSEARIPPDGGAPLDAGDIRDADAGTGQPPINVTFDLHADPEPQALSIDQRRARFRRQLSNASWLLDMVEPYGAKISFLAAGEFYEFCVEPSEKDACFPVLRRLQASGGILGTHQHTQKRRGPHDWPEIAGGVQASDPLEVAAVWADSNAATNTAIRAALNLSDDAAVSAINAACESHVPGDASAKRALMKQYGYRIREGGADQDLIPFFGHVPWNPFRPGLTNVSEDPSTPFVAIPQGMVIGMTGLHKGHWQDGRAAHKKSELVQLLATWAERERTGAPPKVWSFGWGVHTHDIDDGSPSRAAIEELVPWLHASAIGKTSPAGHVLARFASYIDVRDELEAWEARNPGVSSFDYQKTVTDYAAYPYLEWANRYLKATDLASELEAPAGVRLFRLALDDRPLLLAIAWGTTGTIDASALGGPIVRRVDLATGDASDVEAAAAPVGPSSTVLCRPDQCEAILAFRRQEPGPPSCEIAEACAEGLVCCRAPLGCAGKCVPDCRLDGASPCPQFAPVCNPSTGVCSP